MNKRIIDVSSYNGTVDWEKLKGNIDGAILKIIRKDLSFDKQFLRNQKECERLRIPWGVYNYSYAATEAKARADMEIICDKLDKLDRTNMDLGVWFDIEDAVQEALTPSQNAKILVSAQEVVERRGYVFGVYTGMAFYRDRIATEKTNVRNWWLARYYLGYTAFAFDQEPKPEYKPMKPTDLVAWQYTSSCNTHAATGNGGRADMSILYRMPTAKEKVVITKMAVKIGSARIDERGMVSGGAAGDQTGKEVSTQNWYLHSKGWVVIRAKTAVMREKIARCMQAACDNPKIGYDQSQNQTLWKAAMNCGFDCAKIKTKVETDCARLVRVCCWYAGSEPDDFYTATEADTLKATGDFQILTEDKYCKSSDYLMRGDILVTKKTKGHTVVVLSNGAKVSANTDATKKVKQTYSGAFPTLPTRGYYKIGDGMSTLLTKRAQIRRLQGLLNWLVGAKLDIDGRFGKKTEAAVKAAQKMMDVKVDGLFGNNTLAAAKLYKK